MPKPTEIIAHNGEFTLTPQTLILINKENRSEIQELAKLIKVSTGFDLKIEEESTRKKGIHFVIDKTLKNIPIEGYKLDVIANNIIVKANSPTGLYYGTQTLRQLLPSKIESTSIVNNSKWIVPNVTITDAPRYHWRGYMQDASRTFYSVNVIKKYLDVMALYKMNTFHWHLTDDQGWRIEIKKYPKLTSEKTTVFHHTTNQPAERSGFYTQDQIKEVVAYAKERHITIVPEIDVPGHSWPTILAYPELGVNKHSYPNHIFPFVSSWGYWGNQFTPNTLDPTKEIVYEFLNDVFTEVISLFPGQYVHFGGDEVRHDLWEKEPHVIDFMQKNNLKNVQELQSYFVTRISKIISGKGKIPLGWNDILADAKNLPKETAIMSWLGADAIKQAVENGFQSVATPTAPLYFDITQADRNDGTMSDLAYDNINTIERVYNYDPAQGLTSEEEKLVLGVQANQWTALPQEVKDMNVQNFPRLLAVAETGWTAKDKKDFTNFSNRLNHHYDRLNELKVDYYRSGGYIVSKWSPATVSEEFKEMNVDVTKKVYTNGRIQTGFFFTEGKNFLEIDGVQLLEDGKVIASDNHHALADKFRGTNKIKPFFFNFEVKNYNPHSKYTVMAKVRSVGGTNSYGNFTFNLSPYQPFTIAESR
nr:beta-N-acetylhexosaminidase [Sphingobacterium sp. SRCM116780]